jgi:hypothetical protein
MNSRGIRRIYSRKSKADAKGEYEVYYSRRGGGAAVRV